MSGDPRLANLSPAQKRALLAELLRRKQQRPETFPLSFAQERLWFLDRLEPGTALYNIPSAIPLASAVDPAILERSIREIVRRHEVLRTTFTTDGDRPVQVVHPELPFGLDVREHRSVVRDREALASETADAEARRPFDLGRGPLLRAVLLRFGAADNLLLLTIHHIVFDGWSLGVFFRELSALYEAFAAGRPSPLPELPIQYSDFAGWQRQWLQGEVLAGHVDYWRGKLAGAPPMLRLPIESSRPEDQTFVGTMISFELAEELTGGLRELTRSCGVTLFMTLLAAYKTLLYRYTGQEDLVVGSPIANRNRAELEGLIGFFVNTLVLRTHLGGNPSFRELLERVSEVTLQAYEHQDLPFEKLVEELQPQRTLRHTPLCQVVFNLQNASNWASMGSSSLERLTMHSGTAKFDLNLTMAEADRQLIGAFEYNTDLFGEGRVRQMESDLTAVLESVVEDPRIRLLEIPVRRAQRASAGRGSMRTVQEDEAVRFTF